MMLSDDRNFEASSSLTPLRGGDNEGRNEQLRGSEYEVFLSFRGMDTRKGFTDHLYRNLVEAGIRVFRDDNELRVGDEIGPELISVITQSKISIPIISENYASSKWCLDELVQILKCKRSHGQIVLPIFYKVEPSQVRHQTGRTRDAINAYKKNLDQMVVKDWEDALKEVSSLKGWESEKIDNGHEGALVKIVVGRVMRDIITVYKKRRNERPLDRKLVTWEVGRTSGVDDRSFRRRITSWQKGAKLGSGAFGDVYKGFTDDGSFFAVKEVSLIEQGSRGKQNLLHIEQEISLLSQLQHENIVQYFGTEKDDKNLYIFLELMTESSVAMLYAKYKLSDLQVSAYTRQIVNGLKYLHDQGWVHRDIKCANILVHASGSVKLADFGLAKEIKMNGAKSSKGTYRWMAPEVANPKNKSYGFAADIWSLGCTVLEMLTGELPYHHLDEVQALYKIGRGEPPPVRDSLSRDARDFILRCLQVNANNRPSAAELLDHPFVRNASSSFASPHFNNVWP